MVTKVSDVKGIVQQAATDPQRTFPAIMELASSRDWKKREVAATILVEASKKKPAWIIEEMIRWADHSDPNVRRAASEVLRGVARKEPEKVLPVIEKLKADPNIYVKKSVANVLRNAGNYHPEFVLSICRAWASVKDSHTDWIIKDALRKLKETCTASVEEIITCGEK
jgi:3-methyladenine DNA glycosylase AlkC